jgi:hypothetical protein
VSKASAVATAHEVGAVVFEMLVPVVMMKVSVHSALQIELTDISYDTFSDSQVIAIRLNI